MFKTILFVVLALFPTAPMTLGQAQFVEKGKAGLGVSGYYQTNGTDKPLGVAIGFAPSTEFDIGFALGANSGRQGSYVHFLLYLDAWAVNQNSGRLPISLRFNASLESYVYPETGFEHATRESHSALRLETAVHKDLASFGSFKVQPFMGLGRAVFDDEESFFRNGHWTFLAGFSLYGGSGGKNNFVLTNDYSVVNDNVTISLRVGYILGFDSWISKNS